MSKNRVPKHIQRLRAMEERLDREGRAGEIRLQNDIDYAKRNAVRLVGHEIAAQVTEQNAMVGRLISRAIGEKPTTRQYALPVEHEFRTRYERTRPSLSSSIPKLGLKSIMEELILPVTFGLVRGKLLAVGIKGTSKLLRTFVRRVGRAL